MKDEASAQSFDQLASETLEGIRDHESGTLVYVVHTPEGEPLTRIFYELYADRSAFDRHEQQPHVKHFLAEREQHLAATEVTYLAEVAGKRPALES
ncbi:antibiotic biosynthesis monooxygenase [Streptomyces sp. A7024]|uniref:Antibiotic biosynthesis monooxygenase n=2 Tax=Streptomyces coryli TaxID=1128680 RepID=A0A6G4TT43_9ACTN|nr:antibiotic biosynthesis monooxygenase [Streptomyces coryli]NGN63155.1 antibiotic biosynthesis monooxygenase [Streptomyces coryli]